MNKRAQRDGNDVKREIAHSYKNPAQDVNEDSGVCLYIDGLLVKNLNSTERVARVGHRKLGKFAMHRRFMIRAEVLVYMVSRLLSLASRTY